MAGHDVGCYDIDEFMTSRNGTINEVRLTALVTRSMTSRARVTSSRASGRARRHCDVRQIGIGALSVPNFDFFKSDHY